MINQDTKFNYKVIFVALVALIIGILVCFYNNYEESKAQIIFLEKEKELLKEDLVLVKLNRDCLSSLEEMDVIKLQESKYRIDKLLDSIDKLVFKHPKIYASNQE